MPNIVRLTLLKISDEGAIQTAIQKYSTLTQDAKRVRAFFALHNSYLVPCIPARAVNLLGGYLQVTCTSRSSSRLD